MTFDFRDEDDRYLNNKEEEKYEKFGGPITGYHGWDEECLECGRWGCTGGAMCSKAQKIEKEQIDDIEGLSGEEEQRVLEGLRRGERVGQPLQINII